MPEKVDVYVYVWACARVSVIVCTRECATVHICVNVARSCNCISCVYECDGYECVNMGCVTAVMCNGNVCESVGGE